MDERIPHGYPLFQDFPLTHCRQSDLLLLRVPVFWAALQGPGRLVDCQLLSGKNNRNLNHMARKVCSPINQGNSKLKEVFPPASGRVCFGQCFGSDDPFWLPVLWHCWGLFGFRSVARGARVRKLKQGRFLLLLANGLFPGIIWVGQMMRWCQVINGIPRKVKMRNPYLHHCTDVLRYPDFTIAFFGNWGFENETDWGT